MAAMTMPVRSVRVRAGIVEIRCIVTNKVRPWALLVTTAWAWARASALVMVTMVTSDA